jgi:hypothetical protein
MRPPLFDIDQICPEHDLVIHHLGSRDDEARVVLAHSRNPGHAAYVLDLRRTRSLLVWKITECPVLICQREVGSFGWWLKDPANHRQIKIMSKSDVRCSVMEAIAGEVFFRPANLKGNDTNYPG